MINGSAKLSDFGLSSFGSMNGVLAALAGTEQNIGGGTITHMSPELLDSKYPSLPSEKSDMYAFGM